MWRQQIYLEAAYSMAGREVSVPANDSPCISSGCCSHQPILVCQVVPGLVQCWLDHLDSHLMAALRL